VIALRPEEARMKRGRILVLIGIILGLVTTVAVFMILRSPEKEAAGPTETPKQKVLVAIQNIGQAQPIDPAAVELREMEQSQVPPDAVMSTTDIVGKLAAVDIVQGQIIRRDMITDKKSIVEKGINASFLIPPGKVAVAFPIDELSSVAYALEPGDTVDMLITFNMVSVDPETQIKLPLPKTTEEGQMSEPVGQQIPRMVTQLTLQDITVLKVGPWGQAAVTPAATPEAQQQQGASQQGQAGEQAAPPAPTIITLLVSQQDALVLKFAREAGASIDFALRSKNDHEIVETEPVTLDYMIRRFNIRPPERLPFAVEPLGVGVGTVPAR
jgi:Flp pilus assembly protein CpaB